MTLDIQVPSTWPQGVRVVVVGEAPGAEEVDKREGFVGAAGRCLQKAAGVAKLDWSGVARSNVAKRRPASNKFREAFYETIEEPIYTKTGKLSKKTKKVTRKTEELLQWEDLLARELREHNPNLVVAAGNEALETLTGLSGVTDYRGSVVESTPKFTRPSGAAFKVLAVEHPSYIIRGQFINFWILARDLQRAKREMEFPEIRRESYASYPQPTLAEIKMLLAYVADSRSLKWTLDVETRAGTLACFAIACKVGSAPVGFCVPIQTTRGPYWSTQEEWEIWEALSAAANHNPMLCNQNIEYDIYYLLRYGVEPSGVWMDTMLAHSILHPELPKSLDFLASWYLDDVVYWKKDHRDWSGRTPDEALWEYNVKDAVYTLRIVEKIDEELERRGLYGLYHGVACL